MIEKSFFRLPGMKKMFGSLAGIAFLQAFFIVGQAISLAMSIVGVWEGKNINYSLVVLFFLSFTLRHTINWFREKYLDDYARKQAELTRKNLLEKIFEQGPHLLSEEGTGNTVTMVLEGIQEMENYVHLVLSKLLNMAILPIVFVATMFFLDTLSAVLLFLVFPIIVLFMILLGYAAQAKADSQYKNFQRLSNHFIDSLRGLETLKLFGLSKKYARSIYQTSETFRQATMSTLRVAILSTFALDFFTTLSVAVVAVFLGLRLLKGEIHFFPALTTLILAPEFFLPLREFAGDYHATLNGKNSMKAIQKVLQLENVPDKEVLAAFTWTAESTLHLSQYNFKYSNGNGCLDDVTFDVKGLQKIGIIGASGAGKSTLIHALAGFIQGSAKKIVLNDFVIPHFHQIAWQRRIQCLPQKTYLFHGTLRENLLFYSPEASEKELENALFASGLRQWITSLPQGLDTIVGSGGRRLSAGQEKRVALARAFLSTERNILLLDEPTAHLDIETEMEIKESIQPLLEDKLVFLATHRLHWMPEMDKVLVLQHGRVVGFDTHEALLKENSYYQQLIHQMRGEKNEFV